MSLEESDSDLSTTTGSGTESESTEEVNESKQDSKNLDGTSASAREEFKRLTEETDKKNARLQRDHSTHSFAEKVSESKNDTNTESETESTASDSESDSDNSAVALSPKHSHGKGLTHAGGKSRLVTGQHHDEELEMRYVGPCSLYVFLLHRSLLRSYFSNLLLQYRRSCHATSTVLTPLTQQCTTNSSKKVLTPPSR